MGSIIQWAAPNGQCGCAVGPGQVVSVQIRPLVGTRILSEVDGTPPHVLYIPDLAEVGEGPGVQTTIEDMFPSDVIDEYYAAGGPDLLGGPDEDGDDMPGLGFESPFLQEKAPRPTSHTLGTIEEIGGSRPVYMLDIGRSFLCPWGGTIRLRGGRIPVGYSGLCDVSFVRTVPEDIQQKRPAAGQTLDDIVKANTSRKLGANPPSPPTITFRDIPGGGSPIQLPRGVVAVQAGQDTLVMFTPLGGVPMRLVLTTGVPVALGYLSQGTFHAQGGTSIEQLTFILEIA